MFRVSLLRVMVSGFTQRPQSSSFLILGGSYIESYKVTPKRNYFGASG